MRAAGGLAALALALALAACSTPTTRMISQPGQTLGGAEARYLPASEPRSADGSLILRSATDPTGLSIAISSLHYASAPAVVLAPTTSDPEALELADNYGIPVLALPPDAAAEQEGAVAQEVARLGASLVLPVGMEAPAEVVSATELAGEPGALKLPPAADAAPASPWVALVPDEETAATITPLADREGGMVVVAPEPRASGEAVTALAENPEATVVAFGEGFPDEANLTWQVDTARTGVRLPGGDTQTIADGKFYVALYGHPGAPVLGVLGEQGVEATVARAEEHAAMFDDLTEATTVPSLEIIVSVASAFPGSDGNYSNEVPSSHFMPLIEAAHEHDLYVIIDLQPGRTDFLTQAK
ncbi:MAG TPA: hypothetical protein GX743_06395, partial [Actinomycetales bacterium]|nr:hypothetical protein [Actinomycetales bacterium]